MRLGLLLLGFTWEVFKGAGTVHRLVSHAPSRFPAASVMFQPGKKLIFLFCFVLSSRRDDLTRSCDVTNPIYRNELNVSEEIRSFLVIFAAQLIIYSFATLGLHVRCSAELFVSDGRELVFTRAAPAHVPLESPPKAGGEGQPWGSALNRPCPRPRPPAPLSPPLRDNGSLSKKSREKGEAGVTEEPVC